MYIKVISKIISTSVFNNLHQFTVHALSG